MKEFKEYLITGAKELGIELTDIAADQFFIYWTLLVEWNQKFNLTAITEEHEVIIKHFLDSLTCLLGADIKESSTVLDIGTGAGFPGIPLLIVRPDLKLTLMDSLHKRTIFLKEVLQQLNLNENIEIIHGRAEDFGHKTEYREKFEIVVTRAVAKIPVIAEYCLPFAALNGLFMAMKGPGAEDEYSQGDKAVSILGGTEPHVTKVSLPYHGGERYLYTFKKIKSSPKNYPRKAGVPSKKPIS